MAADYFLRQGSDADGLAAELDTPDKRRRYIAQFYGSRFWAAPGSFTQDDVDFMTEPFADADKLRASFGIYESALGTRPPSELPRFFETNPVPTLVLYGPEDHVIPRDFPERCEVAFTERIGPLVVPRAGHFLQWERADVLNQSLIYFLRRPEEAAIERRSAGQHRAGDRRDRRHRPGDRARAARARRAR